MITIDEAESLLETYSLEEILEHNDCDPQEALCFLVNEGFIKLPKVRPV